MLATPAPPAAVARLWQHLRSHLPPHWCPHLLLLSRPRLLLLLRALHACCGPCRPSCCACLASHRGPGACLWAWAAGRHARRLRWPFGHLAAARRCCASSGLVSVIPTARCQRRARWGLCRALAARSAVSLAGLLFAGRLAAVRRRKSERRVGSCFPACPPTLPQALEPACSDVADFAAFWETLAH